MLLKSQGLTILFLRKRRIRDGDLSPRIMRCYLPAAARRIRPEPVTLKRFAAAR